MIVLDTHIWIWWLTLDGKPLKQSWRDAIGNAEAVGVSAISCFEAAWLVRHGRVEIPVALDAWFEAALGGSGIRLLPITPRVAQLAVELPEHHRDPQDRLIIATAIVNDAQLISADSHFPAYEELAGRLIG
ncbi:MAG TPA: type II toxin-antitoxin system VapC family toxin [Thermoanaerobaculia bacterium]|nr:type II toxin-antitoxin system VapC family toxin [Thermoanaerobaculia bacterium]